MNNHRTPTPSHGSARSAPSLPRLATAGLALATAFIAAPAAQAQDSQDDVVKLDPYVVQTDIGSYVDKTTDVATKVPVDLHDLPASVQVLNSSFISDIRAPRLDEAFNYVVGLNRESTNANGFMLRGFSASGSDLHSLQIDGMAGLVSRFASPPTADVERVEVLKGPASVLYGQANPGGIINIVTKNPLSEFRGSVAGYVSTYAGHTSGLGDAVSLTGTVDLTGPIDAGKHWLYRVVASAENVKTFRDYYFEHNYYFYPSLTYQWNDDTWITAKVDVTRETRQANDGLAAPNNDLSLLPDANVTYQQPGDEDVDNGDSLSLEFFHRFSNDWVLDVKTRSTYHVDNRQAFETAGQKITNKTPYTDSTINRRYRHQDNTRRFNYFDANVHGSFGSEQFRNTLLLGVSGGKEFWDFNRLAFGPSISPPVNLYVSVPDSDQAYPADNPNNDRKTNFTSIGVYASDLIDMGSYWSASIGLRRDQQHASSHEIFSDKRHSRTETANFLPSLGLVFHPNKQYSLYASYCEGFKPQSVDFVDANGNPGFPPEKSKQYEVGVKTSLMDDKLDFVLSLYDIKKQNVLENTGTKTSAGDNIYILSGLEESKGVEMQLDYHPIPNWQVQLGYTNIDASVKESLDPTSVGARTDNTPRNSASVWTRYNISDGGLKGLGAGLGVVYVGSRHGNVTNVPADFLVAPSYTRVDFALYYQWRNLNLALNIHNVLDKNYIWSVQPGNATRISPGDPRKVTLSARLDF